MPFGTKIQTYDGAHATHDTGKFTCAVDWASSKLWMCGTVTGTDYLSRHGITTGTEQIAVSTASIIAGLGTGAVGWDGNGGVYLSGPNPLTHGSITQIDADDLTFISNTAYPAPSFGGTNIVSNGGGTTMADTNIGNNIINLNNTSYTDSGVWQSSLGWPAGNSRSSICSGKLGSNISFLINSPGTGGDPDGMLLRSVDAVGAATNVGTLMPTDIDPAWTEAYARAMCVDQTDGHPICNISGVGGSNNNYIVKINGSTGAIEWATALTTTTPESFGDNQWSQSRILHQTLAFIQATPTPTIVVMDTSDGSIASTQTEGLTGVGLFGQQAFDDSSGAIIGMVSADGDPDGPSALNGSTFPFTGWAAIYVTQSAAPAPGNGNRRWLAAIRSVKAA